MAGLDPSLLPPTPDDGDDARDEEGRTATASGAGDADHGVIDKDGMPSYGDPRFWTKVYTGEMGREKAPVEWLVTYEHFCAQGWKRFLPSPPTGPILDLGCGDSDFMSNAYDDGFTNITCADIVPEVLDTMRKRNAEERPGIKYALVDARDMSQFADASFAVVFDKSTMDAIKCANRESTTRMSAEVHRVLKDDGVYLCVSFHPPEDVQENIEDTGMTTRKWSVRVLVCENENWDGTDDGPPQYLYCYASRKRALPKPATTAGDEGKDEAAS